MSEKGVLEIKQRSHPYLHDIFRAALIYDAGKVKAKLVKRNDGKFLNGYKLEFAYPEPQSLALLGDGIKQGDAMWCLSSKENSDKEYIIHEVKTGRFNGIRLIYNYKRLMFPDLDNRKPVDSMWLFIWKWDEFSNYALKHVDYLSRERQITFKVCFFSLDLLIGIIRKRIGEVFE